MNSLYFAEDCPCDVCGSQDSSPIIDVKEAAALLRLKVPTIYDLVYKRLIPYRKHGRRLAFLKSDLIEWSNQRAVGTS